jgi:8-oxo-dGTP diphosphatase
VREETGLNVKVVDFFAVTNNIFRKEKRHSITLFFICWIRSGKLRVMEPEKCERFEWFGWKRLPKPLFLPERTC